MRRRPLAKPSLTRLLRTKLHRRVEARLPEILPGLRPARQFVHADLCVRGGDKPGQWSAGVLLSAAV